MENEDRKSGGEGGIRTLATSEESATCGKHIAGEAAGAAAAAGVCDTIATRAIPAPGTVWRHRGTGEVRYYLPRNGARVCSKGFALGRTAHIDESPE